MYHSVLWNSLNYVAFCVWQQTNLNKWHFDKTSGCFVDEWNIRCVGSNEDKCCLSTLSGWYRFTHSHTVLCRSLETLLVLFWGFLLLFIFMFLKWSWTKVIWEFWRSLSSLEPIGCFCTHFSALLTLYFFIFRKMVVFVKPIIRNAPNSSSKPVLYLRITT